MQSGTGTKAVPYLEHAIALDQSVSSFEAHELLAEHYKSTGDYARAIRYIQLVIQKQQKTDHRHLVKYGELQLKAGDITAAIETFNKAVIHIEGEQGAAANAIELSDSLTQRGVAYRKKGERDNDTASLKRAVQDFQRSIQLTSSAISAHYNLMLTYKKLGDDKKAIETLDRIKAIEPNNCDGWLTLAEAYYQSGELDKATFALGKARKAAGNDMNALKRVLDKFIAYNLFDKAEVMLRELQYATPQESYPYNMLGILFRRQGKVAPAIEQYRKAIALDPADAAIFFNLGRALHDMGRKDEAVQTFQKCLEIEPGMEGAKYYLRNDA
jgi:tetratricopeptide (TPR) repeat protein